MKRLFVFWAMIFLALPFWAYSYKVNVSSTLNLRSEPSTSSQIIGKLSAGDVVTSSLDITTVNAAWVRVEYQGKSGYLMAKYLEPVLETQADGEPAVYKKQLNQLLSWKGDGYRWMVYVICGLVFAMWFECKFFRRIKRDFWHAVGDGNTTYAWINGILLFLTSAAILFYVYQMGSNALWFFMPSMVSAWWWIVIGFIIFVYVLINLLVFFLKTMDDLGEAGGTRLPLGFGLIAWLIAIVLLVICSFTKNDPTFVWVIIGLSQFVQVFIIFYQLIRKRKFLLSIAAVVLYLVGSVSIVVLASCLVYILILLVLAALVLAFSLKMFSNEMSTPYSHSGNASNSRGEAGWFGNYHITNAEGRQIELTDTGNGKEYRGNDGHTYRKEADDNFVRQ